MKTVSLSMRDVSAHPNGRNSTPQLRSGLDGVVDRSGNASGPAPGGVNRPTPSPSPGTPEFPAGRGDLPNDAKIPLPTSHAAIPCADPRAMAGGWHHPTASDSGHTPAPTVAATPT